MITLEIKLLHALIVVSAFKKAPLISRQKGTMAKKCIALKAHVKQKVWGKFKSKLVFA